MHACTWSVNSLAPFFFLTILTPPPPPPTPTSIFADPRTTALQCSWGEGVISIEWTPGNFNNILLTVQYLLSRMPEFKIQKGRVRWGDEIRKCYRSIVKKKRNWESGENRNGLIVARELVEPREMERRKPACEKAWENYEEKNGWRAFKAAPFSPKGQRTENYWEISEEFGFMFFFPPRHDLVGEILV